MFNLAVGKGALRPPYTPRVSRRCGTVAVQNGMGEYEIRRVPLNRERSRPPCTRDWAAEETDHPREVVEAALAHEVQNKVEAAYRRTDLFRAAAAAHG